MSLALTKPRLHGQAAILAEKVQSETVSSSFQPHQISQISKSNVPVFNGPTLRNPNAADPTSPSDPVKRDCYTLHMYIRINTCSVHETATGLCQRYNRVVRVHDIMMQFGFFFRLVS